MTAHASVLALCLVACAAATPRDPETKAALPPADPLATRSGSVPNAGVLQDRQPLPASSAPTGNATAAPDAGVPAPPDLYLDREHEHPTEPAVVVADNADFAAKYRELPKVTELPDFLSVNDTLALLPESLREDARGRIRAQLSGGAEVVLRGAYLDSEERQYLAWVDSNLEQRLAIYDSKGNVTDRRTVSRGRPFLRDVIELETPAESSRGLTREELVLLRITNMSVCCLPSSLELYGLTAQGKLRKLLDFERDHVTVGPGVSYSFANHFEFTNDRRAIVTRIFPDEEGRWEFVYDPARGRYEPTPATRRALRQMPPRTE